jgi:hypothetical protein
MGKMKSLDIVTRTAGLSYDDPNQRDEWQVIGDARHEYYAGVLETASREIQREAIRRDQKVRRAQEIRRQRGRDLTWAEKQQIFHDARILLWRLERKGYR